MLGPACGLSLSVVRRGRLQPAVRRLHHSSWPTVRCWRRQSHQVAQQQTRAIQSRPMHLLEGRPAVPERWLTALLQRLHWRLPRLHLGTWLTQGPDAARPAGNLRMHLSCCRLGPLCLARRCQPPWQTCWHVRLQRQRRLGALLPTGQGLQILRRQAAAQLLLGTCSAAEADAGRALCRCQPQLPSPQRRSCRLTGQVRGLQLHRLRPQHVQLLHRRAHGPCVQRQTASLHSLPSAWCAWTPPWASAWSPAGTCARAAPALPAWARGSPPSAPCAAV